MFPYPFSFLSTSAAGLADIDNDFSMEFDGVDTYIDLGSGLDIFDTTIKSYSVSFWIKWTGAKWYNRILNFGANTDKFAVAQSVGPGLTVAVQSADPLVVYNWIPTGTTLNDGDWHHVCVVIHQGTPVWPVLLNYDIYVDNSNLGSGASTSWTYNADNTIGYSSGSNSIDGSLDEVALFDYALTAPDVADIYNATSTGKTADLSEMSTPPVLWYRMGD